MSDQKHSKTVLGADCRITGELTLDNDAVIMGEFQGMLRVSGVLEITDSAKVSGTVIAGAVRLSGAADADIVAEAGVELLAGARLNGQLYTSTLSVVEGAVFQGDVNVGPKAMEAAEALLKQINAEQPHAPHAGPEVSDEQARDDQEQMIEDEAEAEETGQDADASQAVRTMPNSLNGILQRRRSRVLSAHGTAGKVGPAETPKARAS